VKAPSRRDPHCRVVSVSADDVVDALREAQRLGMLGARPIEDVLTHSRVYLSGLQDVEGRIADLGSGGGVPGLLIAAERPDLTIWLIERRGARADFLRRVVLRLEMSARVSVHEVDAVQFAKTAKGTFDGVTARGFGPPEPTLRIARELISPTGRIVISDPPEGNRWSEALLEELGLGRAVHAEELGRASVFHVKH
jgi:16S rRNA (guanine527-N7)-methyltransferase